MRNPDSVTGQDLAIALLTNDTALGDELRKSRLTDESMLFEMDEQILLELRAASDQAKISAVMTLERIAQFVVVELSAATGRSETEIVADVASRIRGDG